MPSLRSLRIAQGLTQFQFARAAGVHFSTVQRWERGVAFPQGDQAKQVAKVLAIPVEDVGSLDLEKPSLTIEDAVDIEGFRARLIAARMDQGWSVDELARQSQVMKKSIVRVEERQAKRIPRIPTVRKLAEALDVDPDWLMWGKEDNKNAPPK